MTSIRKFQNSSMGDENSKKFKVILKLNHMEQNLKIV